MRLGRGYNGSTSRGFPGCCSAPSLLFGRNRTWFLISPSPPPAWRPDLRLHLYITIHYKSKRGGVWRGWGLTAVVLPGVSSPPFTTLLLLKEEADVFWGHHLEEKNRGAQRRTCYSTDSPTHRSFIYLTYRERERGL